MKNFLIPVMTFLAIHGMAQPEMYILKADSSSYILTQSGASYLASLPLKCIRQEYPNKTNHTSNSDSDHILTPKQLHPAFYGCFDWHSSVHGHWMLVKLLKQFPDMPEAEIIRKTLSESLNDTAVAGELAYWNMPLTAGWERTYGWAWLLKLDEELSTWKDADAIKWHVALQPLTKKVIELWTAFLPKQTYANRTGVHPNTAFGMAFALDYARSVKNDVFEKALVQSAKALFVKDRSAPANWEPNGSDFLSPSLEEADLMRRVLSRNDFTKWFNTFLAGAALHHLSVLPVVSDRTDLQIVHLDGLSFSRAWCMNGIASALPANDARKFLLRKSAQQHLAAALPNVAGGHYGGEHWLASFAVYALQ